jgi:putative transcriptional regulator
MADPGYVVLVPGDPKKSKPPTRLKGRLLLADPSLRDGVFDHSVVLITHHTPEEGAHGVILNHPEDRIVGDLLKTPEFEALRSLRIFQGGPVAQGQLTLAAFSWQPSRGLRYQISLPLEKAIVQSRRPGTLVRAFVGYSGWSSGQLESELERNAWHIVKPGEDLLGLDHARPLWAELMGRISPYHRILASAPSEPWFN